MKRSFAWKLVPLAVYFFLFPHASAQTPCGNIIGPLSFDTRDNIVTTPIENCEDPFKTVNNFHAGAPSPYTLTVEGEVVSGNETVAIPEGGTDDYVVTGTPYFSAGGYTFFYLHDGDDYRYVETQALDFEPTEEDLEVFASNYPDFEDVEDIEQYIDAVAAQDCSTFLDPDEEDLCYDFWYYAEDIYYEDPQYPFIGEGTYTAVITEYDIDLVENSLFKKLWASIIPTAYAQVLKQNIFTVTFTLVEEEPFDPLLLEYLPILRMHPDEDYLPMNVEAFVEASALWDDNDLLPDEIIKEYDEQDPVTVDFLDSLDDTEDMYLAFSDPGNAKSINLAAGRQKYRDLVSEDKAKVTVYARKMQDSYEDSQGEEHEFTVLQYWYFYAMNNWEEELDIDRDDNYKGFNNHEGDWESVFVFLDEGSQPQYVAFSAHHDDGEAEPLNVTQYGSVRRKWSHDQIERDGKNVISYVALGSHANYPKEGNYAVARSTDLTSSSGVEIESNRVEEKIEMSPTQSWLSYEGKWGADRFDIGEGESGPRGPVFSNVSRHLRYHDPLEWAGINEIDEIVVANATSDVIFTSGLKMNFATPISGGTNFSIVPYKDTLVTGTLPLGTQLLPSIWDIESSLVNGEFNTQVFFPIDIDTIQAHGAKLSQLGVYLFKTNTETWEEQQSTLDGSGNFVILNTSHFSRYALGIKTTDPVDSTNTSSGSKQGSKAKISHLETPVSTQLTENQVDREIVIQRALILILEYVTNVQKEGRRLSQTEIKIVSTLVEVITRDR